MDDLVAFLRARLDEDEQGAVRAGGRVWEVGPSFGGKDNMVRIREEDVLVDSVGSCAELWAFVGQTASIPNWRDNAAHIARHNPARELDVVAAHRAIVDWIDYELADDAAQQMPWDLACHLAAVYASHPDYRDEWRLPA